MCNGHSEDWEGNNSKKSTRRNLRQTIFRMTYERKRNRVQLRKSEGELTEADSIQEPKKKKVCWYQGEIIPHDRGFIKLDPK